MRARSSAGVNGAAFLPTLESNGWVCSPAPRTVLYRECTSETGVLPIILNLPPFLPACLCLLWSHFWQCESFAMQKAPAPPGSNALNRHIPSQTSSFHICLPFPAHLWHTSGHNRLSPGRRVTGSMCPIAWWFVGQLIIYYKSEIWWFRRTDTEN